MRRNIVSMMVLFGVALMFSGCASNGYVNAKMLKKSDTVKGIRVTRVGIPSTNTHGYKGYSDFNNAVYRCSLRARLYTIAKEATERGYPYFTLRFPDGSNKAPLAIADTEKILHYCVPGYYDKNTDLLDDKCGHIGLGNGTPSGPKRIDGIFYKKRNPFVPMWDAKKVMKKLKGALLHECWAGREDVFEKVMDAHHDFGTIDMD